MNNKAYVGFTSQKTSTRFRQHCKHHRKSAIHSAIQKHGEDSFSIETLFESTDRKLTIALEEQYIREHHTHISEYGYNLTFGGEAPGPRPNTKWSEERRTKMSAMFRSIDKSYMQTESYKSTMRSAQIGKHIGQGNPLYGRRGPTNPKSQQYLITHPSGQTETIWGGEEKRRWITSHKISPNTFQKMVHKPNYLHSSGIRISIA